MKQDLVAYILGGLGLEFDLVICNIVGKNEEITLQDAQFLLMSYESRLEQYHSSTTIDMTQANLSAKSANFARGGNQYQNHNRGRSRGRKGGRGGRYVNQRLVCQLCGKNGHFSAICYHRFDQAFSGNFGKQYQQGQQSVSTNYTLFPSQAGSHLPTLSQYTQSSSMFLAVQSTAPLCSAQLQSSSAPILSTISSPRAVSSHPMITRSRNGIFKPKSLDSAVSVSVDSASHCLTASVSGIDVPTSVAAALSDPHWNAAMQSEYDALKRNKTWSLVPFSADLNVVGCKWIFRVKYKYDGSIERYKARLAAKGFHQTLGLDFKKTFSPVVKSSTIRIILALAVSSDWDIQHIDINNAFLNSDLHEAVYITQPEGFIHPSQPSMVCKLHKSLYGLK
ncbi:hypothetical protein ACOSQ2_014090 [Xanthoceras sorbifolium]